MMDNVVERFAEPGGKPPSGRNSKDFFSSDKTTEAT
jgi:hypothetical protein